jgi:hypothetical protein
MFDSLLERYDIDYSPLGSFGDGEDVEDDDIEESQSLRKKRTRNYSMIDDTCLVRAWSHVSVNEVTWGDQTDKRYWQCIEDKFCKFMPQVATPVTRSYRSLQGRWAVIKACCSRWAEAMEQVRAQHRSDISIDDYVSALYIFCCNSCL